MADAKYISRHTGEKIDNAVDLIYNTQVKVVDIAKSNWTGDEAPYTYGVTGAVHGQGNAPMVEMYAPDGTKVEFSMNLNLENGDFTILSNDKVSGKILIRYGSTQLS